MFPASGSIRSQRTQNNLKTSWKYFRLFVLFWLDKMVRRSYATMLISLYGVTQYTLFNKNTKSVE